MILEEKQGFVIQKKQMIIGICLVVMLIIGGVFVGLNWNNGNNDETQLEIDQSAKDWTEPLPEEEGGASQGIAIPGYPSVIASANTKDMSIVLLNPEGNPCYFTFELIIKDTSESLYQSKLVPPGKAINKITLSRELKAGSYPLIIRITTISLQDQTPMNSADVETVLTVK